MVINPWGGNRKGPRLVRDHQFSQDMSLWLNCQVGGHYTEIGILMQKWSSCAENLQEGSPQLRCRRRRRAPIGFQSSSVFHCTDSFAKRPEHQCSISQRFTNGCAIFQGPNRTPKRERGVFAPFGFPVKPPNKGVPTQERHTHTHTHQIKSGNANSMSRTQLEPLRMHRISIERRNIITADWKGQPPCACLKPP